MPARERKLVILSIKKYATRLLMIKSHTTIPGLISLIYRHRMFLKWGLLKMIGLHKLSEAVVVANGMQRVADGWQAGSLHG
jgi:hypothetical protein